MKSGLKNRKFSKEVNLELEVINLSSGRHSCTKKGGRIQSFSSIFISGNRNADNPVFGFGRGKAKIYSLAKQKASRKAANGSVNIFVPFDKTRTTIKHPLTGRSESASVVLMPGSGLNVPDSCRALFELIGLHNVSMKIVSSTKNKKNIIYAILDAFHKASLFQSF